MNRTGSEILKVVSTLCVIRVEELVIILVMGLKGFLQSAIRDGPYDIDVVGYVTLGLADVLELFSQVLVYLLIFGQELIDL